jgi:uncharacterized protein (TIGR03000 family)
MYSVLVTALISFGTTTPEFGWRNRSTSCYGCQGGAPVAVYGYAADCCPPSSAPLLGLPTPVPPVAGLAETTAPPAAGLIATNPNQAQFVVELPADAKLYVEGQLIPITGPVRVFQTPPLDPQRKYVYKLEIEIERGGKVLRSPAQERDFQAGQVARVFFTELTPEPPPAAKSTAHLRVRVPDGATLYVEGQRWGQRPGWTWIPTPPLEAGRTHYYSLRIEAPGDSWTREVGFRAGQVVDVDLSERPSASVVKR